MAFCFKSHFSYWMHRHFILIYVFVKYAPKTCLTFENILSCNLNNANYEHWQSYIIQCLFVRIIDSLWKMTSVDNWGMVLLLPICWCSILKNHICFWHTLLKIYMRLIHEVESLFEPDCHECPITVAVWQIFTPI